MRATHPPRAAVPFHRSGAARVRAAAWARIRTIRAALAGVVLVAGAAAPARAQTIRASYFYSYMSPDHLDSLGRAGFNRAVIKCIQDSLGSRGAAEYQGFFARAPQLGIEVVPEWSLQAASRLAALPSTRRYTWGTPTTTVEPGVGCPSDSLFWRSTLRDRAAELLAAFPALRHLALDLEIYTGSRHHYDAGPCRCPACLAEFAARPAGAPGDLASFQEQRVAAILEALLRELAAVRPGLALDVFDLDFDSFVHRGMVRALARSGTRTTNYSERTYADPAAAGGARAVLDSLGLGAPLAGGLQLKNFTPANLVGAASGILGAADGYFIFTSYSLWQSPANLTGPYVLLGSQDAYWEALHTINGAPSGVPPPVAASDGARLRLLGAGANPFTTSCAVRFELRAPADVALSVVDPAGREIRRIVAARRPAGVHTLSWDGRDAAGRAVGSGTWFLRLAALGETRVVRRTRIR